MEQKENKALYLKIITAVHYFKIVHHESSSSKKCS